MNASNLTIYQAAELTDSVLQIRIDLSHACQRNGIGDPLNDPDSRAGRSLSGFYEKTKGNKLSIARALALVARWNEQVNHYSLRYQKEKDDARIRTAQNLAGEWKR